MLLLNLLLNLAGLLLWFGFRIVGLDRQTKLRPLSLASTLKRAETKPARPWSLLATLLALLVGRSLLYWQLSDSTVWSPEIDFGLLTLPFRIDTWPRALLYSGASFLHALVVAHIAILLPILLNRRSPKIDPFQLLLNAQWGWLSRWPAFVLLPLIPLLAGAFWLGLERPLVWLEITSNAPAKIHPLQQAVTFGLNVFLIWSYAACLLLLAHWINTYVYVGNLGLWNCLAAAGHRLVHWLRIRLGKLDLAPPLGIAVVLLLSHYARVGLVFLFSHPQF
jgi:hypothetical protein